MASAEEGRVRAAQLLNDLQEISFTKIALIVAGTWLGIVLARKVLPFVAQRGPSQLRLYLLGAVPVIRLVLLAVAILWVIPIVFNVTLQNFLVLAGAVGVAIGFAFKDYLSSLIAGIVAVFERPYRPGDWVEIDGDYGEVLSVGMRALRLRTPSDDVVTVSHDKLWKSNISNSNDGERTLMCVTTFHLAPDHDAERVRDALRDVGLTSAYLEYDRPVIVVLEQKPWATQYALKAYPFDMRDQFAFISDLTIRGKRAIVDAGAREADTPAWPDPAERPAHGTRAVRPAGPGAR
ncbi:MAG: mechanosensitive ion channel family protein [Lautropia sp.]